MKLRDITNPRHVYEGAFETYFIRPFVHRYADFTGGESMKDGLRSLLAWGVVTLGVAGVLMGLVGLMGPEAGFSAMRIIGIIWILISVCPLAALLVRMSRGPMGKRPAQARMLGIDTMLAVSCLLFFALGLLMMVTTLDSGALNPNANATDEPDTVRIEGEHVTEEPIFTYQDESAAKENVTDSLGDFDDPDQLSPDDVYDPALATDGAGEIAFPASDSI